jgi:hypothetical protein
MFHMSGDSGLFCDTPEVIGQTPRLPLYEAKMIHQFDHRWATYVDAPDQPNGLDTADLSDAQRADPSCTLRPRYWVDEAQVLSRIARVPSRVANAWLAWKEASSVAASRDSDTALSIASSAYSTGSTGKFDVKVSETADALTLALASWVAGELFRRSAGQPLPSTVTSKPSWSSAVAWQATQTVEVMLAAQYPALSLALKENDTSGKKALPAFTKWALQDDAVGLSDAELAEVVASQKPATATVGATVSVASHGDSTGARGQFDLNFVDVWMDRRSPRWLMGWRNIARNTDERSYISAVMPRFAVGHSMPLWYTNAPAKLAAAYLANMSMLVFDYVVRQKLGGTNMTLGYVKQFPVLPPDSYTDADLAYIVPRVLELTHTAYDMQAWADDLAAYDPRPPEQRRTPYGWHPERRAQLRAELDAYYARLYGLTRDELRYILDPADAPFGPGGALLGPDYPSETFRGLKTKEERAYGEYRTRRLVLAAWDNLARTRSN